MKTKILFVLGGAVLLLAMFIGEMVPVLGVLWIVRDQDFGGSSICSAWPYIVGIFIIVLVLVTSRKATVSGMPIDNTPQVIHLGYSREDCDDVIMYAAAIADARKGGRQMGAPIVIELPPGFSTDRLDPDTLDNYRWLLQHPETGVTIKK